VSKKFHHAFGVYGIITIDGKLVVIKKTGGPYLNRYDLPGGSLDDGEPLDHAIGREIHEETQLTVEQAVQLGTTSFRYPWRYQNWTFNQHICVFYEITKYTGSLATTVSQFVGQDALGAVAMNLDQLTIANASPLVLKAIDYLKNQRHFEPRDQYFETWPVLAKPVF